MRLQDKKRARRGATAVESSVIILVFVVLTVGAVDLAVAVLRYHMVSHAARHGARLAIVHGSLASPEMEAWGPDNASTAQAAIRAAIEPNMVGVNSSDIGLQTTWIDGGNQPGNRIRVVVTVPYRPALTFLFGNPTITLRATSTVPIAH